MAERSKALDLGAGSNPTAARFFFDSNFGKVLIKNLLISNLLSEFPARKRTQTPNTDQSAASSSPRLVSEAAKKLVRMWEL